MIHAELLRMQADGERKIGEHMAEFDREQARSWMWWRMRMLLAFSSVAFVFGGAVGWFMVHDFWRAAVTAAAVCLMGMLPAVLGRAK